MCKHQNASVFVDYVVPTLSRIFLKDGEITKDSDTGEGHLTLTLVTVVCEDCGLAKEYRKPPKWILKLIDRYNAQL